MRKMVFNISKDDIIYGVEDLGNQQSKEGANSALLFMLQGIKQK